MAFRYGPGPLLDSFPGAQAAYSLRKVNSSYTGPCLTVRRSSDNATTNIGFFRYTVDTDAILNFVGSGNGFVTTWFDQSGRGINVSQGTNANQPLIVNTGSLYTRGGKPSIYFIRANSNFLRSSTISVVQPISFFSAGKTEFTDPNVQAGGIVGSNSAGISTGHNSVFKKVATRAGVFVPASTAANNNAMIAYGLANGVNSETYNNLILESSGNSGTGGMVRIDIGLDAGSNYYEGHIHEAIIYNSNQSSNRLRIQTNMNGYYLIY